MLKRPQPTRRARLQRPAARPPDLAAPPGAGRPRRRRPGRAALPAHPRPPEPVETVARALGLAGEYGAIWAGIGALGASVDPGRARPVAAAGASGPAAVGVNLAVKLAIGRRAPADRGAPAAGEGADQALVPLRARDLVGRRRDRARAGPAARAAVPVRARGGDLRRPSLPRHALPVRRPRRRRAGLLPRVARSPASGRATPRSACSSSRSTRTSARQATERAPGNGGAVAVGEPGHEAA